MNEIRAFVGHSFNSEDEGVVREFLKYFDQLKGIHQTFSWEHAEAAETVRLAEKVLRLIADKNTFIAICTRRERVVPDSSLSSVLFQQAYRKAKEDDFEWKASDWIIQEIGLAKGRGLELILLVEEGIRLPGGLQGDVEYIPFTRAFPQKSFGKIVEMLHSLVPKPSGGGVAGSEESAIDTAAPQTAGDAENVLVPTIAWGRKDYELALFRAIHRRNEEATATINERYLATADAQIGLNRATWAGLVQMNRLLFGKDGSLETLKRVVEDNPGSAELLSYLALAYSYFDDYQKAAETYEKAADAPSEPSVRQQNLRYAATQRAKAGDLPKARAISNEVRRMACAGLGSEREAISAIRDLADIAGDPEAEIVAMERLVELAPDDTEARFSLAYKYGELGNHQMAFAHYLKIPFGARTAFAWNNLGVAFKQHAMPGKSVSAYKRAVEMGESLAMSNLANAYMDAGFLKEAQGQLDQAVAVQDFHKNVAQGLTTLKEIPESENKKQSEVLERCKPKVEFYRAAGKAVVERDISAVDAIWRGLDCTMALAITDGNFVAIGEYERESSVSANPLFGSLKRKVQHKIEYKGMVTGRFVRGKVRRTSDDQSAASTILSLNDVETNFLGILAGDNSELRVIENPHSANATFYSLTAIRGTGAPAGQLPSA